MRPTGPSRPRDQEPADALRPTDEPVDRTPVGYRLRPGVGLRLVGAGCVWLCVPLGLEVLRRTVPATDVLPVTVLRWAAVVLFAVIVLTGAWLLLDRRPRLLLTAEGYTHRSGLGRRRTTGRWDEVAGVQTVDSPAGPVLRIERRDGTVGLVPGRALDADLGDVEREFQLRLNDAHGYRPLS